jgi:hypothetical protein
MYIYILYIYQWYDVYCYTFLKYIRNRNHVYINIRVNFNKHAYIYIFIIIHIYYLLFTYFLNLLQQRHHLARWWINHGFVVEAHWVDRQTTAPGPQWHTENSASLHPNFVWNHHGGAIRGCPTLLAT